MLLMAGPMIVLFEGAIQIARVVDKRRAKREADRGLPRRRRRRGLAAGRPRRPSLDTLDPRHPSTRSRDRRRGPRQPCRGSWAGPRPHRRRPHALRAAGLTPRLLPATTGAEAERQAAEAVAAGVGALVAVGGDGTVHAAVQAVAGTSAPLAVVPAGTGNDFAGAGSRPTRCRRPRRRRGPRRRRRPHDRRREDRRPLVGRAVPRLRRGRHRSGQPAALAARPPPLRRRHPR